MEKRIYFPQHGDLSQHLSASEVEGAADVVAFDLDARLPLIFELVRKYAGGTPLRVTSSFRTSAKNKDVGGVLGSSHTRGNAFDISLNPTQKGALKKNLDRFLLEAVDAGLSGFGVYPTHIHVDTERNKVVRWWHTGVGQPSFFVRHWSNRGEPEWLKVSMNPGTDFSEDEIKEDSYNFDGSQYILLITLALFALLTYFVK